MNTQWKSVSKPRPCNICGKPDWCAYAIDEKVEICRRIYEQGGRVHSDKSGGEFYLYGKAKPRVTKSYPAKTLSMALMPQVRSGNHEVYTALIQHLSLSEKHLGHLESRGFTRELIDLGQYRSLDQVAVQRAIQALRSQFSLREILSTPGFYGDDHELKLASSQGLIVPVRDLKGTITALKIRSFNRKGPKYYYLSSARYGGSPAKLSVHVPVVAHGNGNTIRITEGELKADYATHATGYRTVSIPGVCAWRLGVELVGVLRPKRVLVALDMDHEKNQAVRSAVIGIVNCLSAMGFSVGVELWN